MQNSGKEEITITDENIFVKLILSKEDMSVNNDAILIGLPTIKISDKARKIWNKLAPMYFMACPCDHPDDGFYLNTSWDIPETKFNSLKEAKADLKNILMPLNICLSWFLQLVEYQYIHRLNISCNTHTKGFVNGLGIFVLGQKCLNPM